jgi:hypothetical protein
MVNLLAIGRLPDPVCDPDRSLCLWGAGWRSGGEVGCFLIASVPIALVRGGEPIRTAITASH